MYQYLNQTILTCMMLNDNVQLTAAEFQKKRKCNCISDGMFYG